MITEQSDFDLELLADRFTVCGDYTKEVILDELEYWKKNTKDFLCLISSSAGVIDGFLIGYRSRNSLWISQVYRKAGSDLLTSMEAITYAKQWARERGMTSLTGETDRKQMKAMERYGFREESVIMKVKL